MPDVSHAVGHGSGSQSQSRRLLVVSHPCVTPINQDFFAHVEAESEWRVTIVLPMRWPTEYGQHRTAARWHRFHGRLLPLPVYVAGSVPLHFYSARLRRIFEREKPSAIYVHNEPYALATYQAFCAGRRLTGVPIGFYSAQNLRKRYPWPISRWERYVYMRASFALPVTTSVGAVLEAKGYRGRAEVLPLTVDTAFYKPDEARGGPELDGLTVGFAGRLAPGKGVETLLAALSILPAAQVRAVIVGDGPSADSLKRRAQQLSLEGRIRWTGYVPHERMPSAYRAMDVLVVPSRTLPHWREQFGRVVLEALACGIAVVASDSGELPNLLAATGGGWTFHEGDHAALAAILHDLSMHPEIRCARGAQGRRAVERDFAAKTTAARLVGVLEAAVRSQANG